MGQTVSGSARSYSYDGLNRLTSTSQGESYGYDRYGNRAVTARTGLPPLTLETPTATTAYSTSSNRIAGFGYDSRGNVTTVPGPNSTNIRIASYDAENHQTSETNVNGVSATYGYDGEGRRVTKTTAGVTTTFVYDAAGELVAEYGGTPSGTGRQFLTVDHLGTTRQITDASGAVIKTKDFLPFGEELNVACYSTDNGPGFTGQYGDKESCLDYYMARYLSPAQGRFTSPDKPLEDQHSDDPQSWNLFGYVRNNPLVNIDKSGRSCTAVNVNSGFCQRADLYSNLNSMVRSQTSFFAAASAATQAIANADVHVLSWMSGVSGSTTEFLEKTGQALEKLNLEAFGAILSGRMTGTMEQLDRAMVHKEQSEVQHHLNSFKRADPTGYTNAMTELNNLLNGKANPFGSMFGALSNQVKTDNAYNAFLETVRKGLGHGIDFSNQRDREAIGNALVKRIRESGACDIAEIECPPQ